MEVSAVSICILLCYFIYFIQGEVAFDYYDNGGKSDRTETKNRESECPALLPHTECKLQCTYLPQRCIDADCSCQYTVNRNIAVEEFNRAVALRHHIAHFCPTQDIARKCIRHCMEVGKPSFCGKDLNCYCGHRYNGHDINKKIDPKAISNQFRDLYEKYFGPEADMNGMKN